LVSISHKWEELGSALDLRSPIIEEARQSPRMNIRLIKIIQEWIAGNGVQPTTLRILKSKLELEIVGEKNFAKKLITKFSKEKFP